MPPESRARSRQPSHHHESEIDHPADPPPVPRRQRQRLHPEHLGQLAKVRDRVHGLSTQCATSRSASARSATTSTPPGIGYPASPLNTTNVRCGCRSSQA